MQGNVTDRTGRLFRMYPDGDLALVTGGLSAPKGLSFDPSGKILWVSEHL